MVNGKNKLNNSERTWGMIVHLSALVQLVFHFFGLIIGPLIVWLLKKKTMPFVDEQGKEVLNFNISVTIYALIIGIGASLMPFSFHKATFYHMAPLNIDGIWMGIFTSAYMVFLLITFSILFLFWIVNVVRGAINANKGIHFKYPLTIRLLKK